MSEYIHATYKRTVRTMIIACGILFSVFSFVYLYVFQRYVLEAVHFTLSEGKTHFAPLPSALVITALLLLLRCAVNGFLKLRGNIRSLSYLPSFLVLCALTSVGRGIYMQQYRTVWVWLLPLLIVLFLLVGYGVRRLFRSYTVEESQPIKLVNCNLAVLLLMCLMTVWVGNTDRSFHHELEAEHYLRMRNYDAALQVGSHTGEATQTLTALRALALSHSRKIGAELFRYPQAYGAEGLFFPNDSLQTLRYTNDSVYYHIGVRPYRGESHVHLLHDACYKDSVGKYTALDYYLAALLLDKRLDAFAEALNDFYSLDDLPRYYDEALTLYQALHPSVPAFVTDSTSLKRYDAYVQLKAETPAAERGNRTRQAYGDTYWWYFDNVFPAEHNR